MKYKMNISSWFITLWASTVAAFLIGIFMPAFIMDITLGSFFYDAIANSLLGGGFGTNEISIIDSVRKLVGAGGFLNIGFGIIIAAFSIVFPIIKYTLLMVSFFKRSELIWGERILKYSKLSMLDVFVIGILVVGFKDFPGGSRIVPGVGIYFFAASVLMSMLSHEILKKIIKNETK